MLYGNDTLVLMDTGLMRPGCAFADMGDDDKGHDRGHCFSRAVAYHLDASAPVSYTHLTLPTNREV